MEKRKVFRGSMSGHFYISADSKDEADRQWDFIYKLHSQWVEDLQERGIVGHVISAFAPTAIQDGTGDNDNGN